MAEIIAYTDGACSGNPGPGGYGAILTFAGREKEIWGGFLKTTNNRMEILAAIVALEALKRSSEITVVTDSRYLVDAMTKGWVAKWKSKGWMRTNKDKAKNADLWERMLLACEGHEVHWRWVKGHAGHEMNERADQLAVKGRDDRSCQMEDFGFQGMDD